MAITELVLILFIVALVAFAIYDQFIMPRRNGPTLLPPCCQSPCCVVDASTG